MESGNLTVVCSLQCGEGPAPGTGKAGPGPDVAGRREGSGPPGWRGGSSLRGTCQSKCHAIACIGVKAGNQRRLDVVGTSLAGLR